MAQPEGLTKEKLDEMWAAMRKLMPPEPSIFNSLGLYGGLFIQESPLMTETETYTEMVQLTWRERLWEPLKHGATLPFEPWVKMREVMRTRQVPSRKVYMMDGTLICHPAIKSELHRVLHPGPVT